MRITQISVTYERKLNTGNYSSATIGTVMWADIDEDEDPEVARQELLEACKHFVRVNSTNIQ